jgi:hypothetical protein
MKRIALLSAFLVASCASSFRVDPTKISVIAEPPNERCGASDKEVHAILHVKNEGRAILKIWVLGPKGPPYELSWLSYEILNDAGGISWEHGPGGHGPMPPSTLRIGPGDSTTVLAPIYALNPNSYHSTYSVRIKDEDGNSYVTDKFSPCKL